MTTKKNTKTISKKELEDSGMSEKEFQNAYGSPELEVIPEIFYTAEDFVIFRYRDRIFHVSSSGWSEIFFK